MQPEENIPLSLFRADLEDILEFELPANYTIRWYRPGDELHWLNIHKEADQYNAITPELFTQQFGSDPGVLEQRQCYLVNECHAPIGTASAWFDDQFEGGPIGRVHWLALLPAYQGHGLSKPLMTAVCRRLRELGHTSAYLSTSSSRSSAIRLYLKFRFLPMIRNEREKEIWES